LTATPHYPCSKSKIQLPKEYDPFGCTTSAKGSSIYKKEKKRKCKLIYLSSVWEVLAEMEDFG
jgi:hypothetical protein